MGHGALRVLDSQLYMVYACNLPVLHDVQDMVVFGWRICFTYVHYFRGHVFTALFLL